MLRVNVCALLDLVQTQVFVDVIQFNYEHLRVLLVNCAAKHLLARQELSGGVLFEVVELGLDGLVDFLFNIVNNIELTRAGLELFLVTGTELIGRFIVEEETIEILELDKVYRL